MNGPELRELRERYGFTQQEVATVLNVSVGAVSRIEHSESLDQVTAARYSEAVAFLRGLMRQMSRRLTRAMRQELAAV